MKDANPYEPPAWQSKSALSTGKPRSRLKWALVGFALGAATPVANGVYGIHEFNVYAASLPPGTFVCGNPMIASIAMILVIGPIGGLIGAAAGWAAAASGA